MSEIILKNNDKKQISTQEKHKKNFEIENVSIDYHMLIQLNN